MGTVEILETESLFDPGVPLLGVFPLQLKTSPCPEICTLIGYQHNSCGQAVETALVPIHK